MRERVSYPKPNPTRVMKHGESYHCSRPRGVSILTSSSGGTVPRNRSTLWGVTRSKPPARVADAATITYAKGAMVVASRP